MDEHWSSLIPAEPGPALPAQGAEGHDCWGQCIADLERAVALIRRDARRHHLPASDVDDVVQDALCQAWIKRAEYDRTRSLAPWLSGVGRRAILARLLTRSLTDAATKNGEDPGALHERRERRSDESAEERETRERLRSLLGQAPSRYREVLIARYWEGLRVAAVAARLSQSPKAIRKCLDRALTWLEAEWHGTRSPSGSAGSQQGIQESEGKTLSPFRIGSCGVSPGKRRLVRRVPLVASRQPALTGGLCSVSVRSVVDPSLSPHGSKSILYRPGLGPPAVRLRRTALPGPGAPSQCGRESPGTVLEEHELVVWQRGPSGSPWPKPGADRCLPQPHSPLCHGGLSWSVS